MVSTAIFGLTVAAAIGSGLVAGIFFAFSTFVIAGLGRIPAGTQEAGAVWSRYLDVWTGWNHVRTVAPPGA